MISEYPPTSSPFFQSVVLIGTLRVLERAVFFALLENVRAPNEVREGGRKKSFRLENAPENAITAPFTLFGRNQRARSKETDTREVKLLSGSWQ
mmetsp:Transcript_56066/g.114609  ORF Transcript_56066/g.114609 Transcript_56066/m.114609 type:complete len:94 (-) Transcript_56066:105-386(-)